jgi:DeoR family transcriptional regulator of aga operon
VAAEDNKNLMAVERRERIIELVAQHGAVRVSELSELFQVSEVTIRNDLELLSKQGILVRDRGGAVANPQRHLTVAFVKRASLHLDQKRRIGLAAAHLVEPGDTIIMDAGTTLMEMAKNLRNDLSITVVTNALNIATHVGTLPDAHVILLGGSLLRGTISTAGPVAECALDDLIVQKTFLGIHSVDEEAGLSDSTIEVARVKRGMVKAAQQVILLADSSKWGHVAFAKAIPLSEVNVMITDSGLPETAQETIRNLGIELILV